MRVRNLSAVAAVAAAVAALVPAGASGATGSIYTVAGGGGSLGDNGPAATAQLSGPTGIAVTADGGYLIADRGHNRIRRVSPLGIITTVAGDGTQCSTPLCGDGGPATAAQLKTPDDVDVTADGGFLIADGDDNRVRKVDPNGTITTLVGDGTADAAGDGGPATEAHLNNPTAVAVTADGGFLIADRNNHRVRYVDPGGTINTVAGDGTPGLGGDGGPATEAQLNDPTGVAVTADGGFLIADQSTHRVRYVSPQGTITTVAGTIEGLSGDGGPATAAQLRTPAGVVATPDGGFLVTDQGNDRVRRVSPGGRITTVAGTVQGFEGDGGPATTARLNAPSAGPAITAGGGVLVPDQNNDRVRFVDTDLRGPGTGPAGPAGPPGPRGPQGPAGPGGPTGERLVVVLASGKLKVAPRARVRIAYALTAAASVEATLGKGGSSKRAKRRSSKRATGALGRNRINVRAPRKPGSYRLTLTATSADGQSATDTARVKVTRAKPRGGR